MTRVLLVEPGPDFSVADVSNGWKAGLEANGCDVRVFPMGHWVAWMSAASQALDDPDTTDHQAAQLVQPMLRGAALDWWPDLVVVVSGFYVTGETLNILRARRMPVAVIFTESPYEDDDQAHLAAFADFAIVNDPTNLDLFRQHNPNTHWMPHAWDPRVHRRQVVGKEYRSDVCFVGSGFPSRVATLEAVDWRGIDFALAGHWFSLTDDSPIRPFLTHPIDCCCPNDEAAKLYSGTKLGLNIYRREAQRPELSAGWAMGPREVELAAIGVPFITEPRGENRERFPYLPTFDDPVDLSEKLRWWLGHDIERQALGRRLQAAVADQTFDEHARRLLAAVL